MSVVKEQDADYQKFGDFTFVSCGMEHSDDEEFPHVSITSNLYVLKELKTKLKQLVLYT